MLSFIPDFRSENFKKQIEKSINRYGNLSNSVPDLCPNQDQLTKSKREFNIQQCDYYFLVDRSGSMMGKSIIYTIESLKMFLKSLPARSRFNIISFGTNFQYMFPQIINYNQSTMEDALEKLKSFDASMGGTEILKPLKSIFNLFQEDKDQFKQIFLLTDGQVSNTRDVVEEVTKMYKQNQRLHTFGIGSGVSTDFIINLARAGGGMHYFINQQEDYEKYVIEALCINVIPYLKVEDIKFFNKDNKLIYTSQNTIAVANGSFFKQTFLIQGSETIHQIKYTIINPNQQEKEEFQHEIIYRQTLLQVVMSACARDQINQYLNQRQPTKAIALSKKYNVICRLTSFFASKSIINTKGMKENVLIEPSNLAKFCKFINVKTLKGKLIQMCVEPTYTILQIMEYIYDIEGIPINEQTLLLNGRQLEKGKTLINYKIQDQQTLHLSGKYKGSDHIRC